MSSIIVGLAAASASEPEPFDVDLSTISYDNTSVAPVQCIVPSGSSQMNNNNIFGGEPFVYNIKSSRNGLGITVGQGTNANYTNWELLFGGGPWMPGNTELFETSYVHEPQSFRSAQGGWSWIDSNTALLYCDNTYEHALQKYTVSTPYDISTRAVNPTQVFNANNTHWHQWAKSFFGDEDNGTFIVLADSNGLFRYDLTEAWNVATIPSEPNQYYAFGNVLPDTNRPTEMSSVFMNKAGDKLFYTDQISDQDIHMKELSTPWDLTTVSASTTTYDSATYGLITSDSTAPSPQGNSYCCGILWNETIQSDHTVNVANSTFLAIGANSYFDHSTATATTGGLQKFLRWKFDGRTAICSAADNKKVISLKLSQPWVISSATYDNANLSSDFSSVVGISASFVRDFHIKDNGKRAWVLFDTPERIYQLDFTTPWDLSTAQYNSVSFLVDGTVLSSSMDMYSMAVNEDGTRIIMTDEVPTLQTGTPKFWQINVSTPWDLSTASYSGNSLTVNPAGQGWSQEDRPAVYISPRGDFMASIGPTIDHMHQWTLSTPGDISTATYDYTYTGVSNENGNPRGVSFSTDGTFMYIMNNENTAGNTRINQYHTGGQHASLGVTTWEGRGAFGHPAGKYCALVNGWTQQNMLRIGTAEKPSHSQNGQVLERVYTYDNMDWPSYVSGGQVAQIKGIANAGYNNDNAPNYYVNSYHWWIGTYPGEDGYNSTSGAPEYIVNIPNSVIYGTQMALHSWRMSSPGDIRSMNNGYVRRVKSTDTSGTYGLAGRGIDFTRSGYLLHMKESGSGSTQSIHLDYTSVNGPEGTFDFGSHTSRELITWFRDTTDFTDTNYDATDRTVYDYGLKLRKEALFDTSLNTQQRLWFLTEMTGIGSNSTWNGYVMRCATATTTNVNISSSSWSLNTGANYFWEIPQGTPGSGIDGVGETILGWDVSSDGTIILLMTGVKLYKFKATSGWNLGNSNITFEQAVNLPLTGQAHPRGCWLNHEGNKLYVVDVNGFFYQYSFS